MAPVTGGDIENGGSEELLRGLQSQLAALEPQRPGCLLIKIMAL
jgi:hypothetical protein